MWMKMSNKICTLKNVEYCLLKDERNLNQNHSNVILHLELDKETLEKTLKFFDEKKKTLALYFLNGAS